MTLRKRGKRTEKYKWYPKFNNILPFVSLIFFINDIKP